jgi:hypothetical protein
MDRPKFRQTLLYEIFFKPLRFIKFISQRFVEFMRFFSLSSGNKHSIITIFLPTNLLNLYHKVFSGEWRLLSKISQPFSRESKVLSGVFLSFSGKSKLLSAESRSFSEESQLLSGVSRSLIGISQLPNVWS